MKKIIELKNISKSFDGEKVLDNVSLDIYDGEFMTLLGPSGCGKTTTLRLIGGFETADEGDVIFKSKRINDVPAHKRHVNTVFQKYALFPHLNVFENIAFSLRLQKVEKKEIVRRVKEILEMVSLKGFEHKNVTLLSGGQQQRVAIARALIWMSPWGRWISSCVRICKTSLKTSRNRRASPSSMSPMTRKKRCPCPTEWWS